MEWASTTPTTVPASPARMKATCTPIANTVAGMRKGSKTAKRKTSLPQNRYRDKARPAMVATVVVKKAQASAMATELPSTSPSFCDGPKSSSIPRAVRLSGSKWGQGHEAVKAHTTMMARGGENAYRLQRHQCPCRPKPRAPGPARLPSHFRLPSFRSTAK